MKRIHSLGRIALILSVALVVLSVRTASAQDSLKNGKVLQRTELADAKGSEAIMVLRELPPGAESGKHTQPGNEFVYIADGSVIFEAQGKAPVTLKAGESFQTAAGEVHNVKNASATEPAKAIAFYIAKKGTPMEELSLPAK
ncbi:MAG: cupin domain-containing protein [Spartobacteria bacterium]